MRAQPSRTRPRLAARLLGAYRQLAVPALLLSCGGGPSRSVPSGVVLPPPPPVRSSEAGGCRRPPPLRPGDLPPPPAVALTDLVADCAAAEDVEPGILVEAGDLQNVFGLGEGRHAELTLESGAFVLDVIAHTASWWSSAEEYSGSSSRLHASGRLDRAAFARIACVVGGAARWPRAPVPPGCERWVNRFVHVRRADGTEWSMSYPSYSDDDAIELQESECIHAYSAWEELARYLLEAVGSERLAGWPTELERLWEAGRSCFEQATEGGGLTVESVAQGGRLASVAIRGRLEGTRTSRCFLRRARRARWAGTWAELRSLGVVEAQVHASTLLSFPPYPPGRTDPSRVRLAIATRSAAGYEDTWVSIDGERLGLSPVTALVPAGPHIVTLVSPETGATRVERIEIEPSSALDVAFDAPE